MLFLCFTTQVFAFDLEVKNEFLEDHEGTTASDPNVSKSNMGQDAQIGHVEKRVSTSKPALNPYDYRIGILDLLEVKVFQVDDLNVTSRVNAKGDIAVPLIGHLKVVGLSVAEAESLIERELARDYMQNPHVTVFVKEYESQKITVEGQVNNPGVIPLKGRTSFLQAIAAAKGFKWAANTDEIVIYRKIDETETAKIIVNVEDIREGKSDDIVMHPNDVIVVLEHGGKGLIEDFNKVNPLRSLIPVQ